MKYLLSILAIVASFVAPVRAATPLSQVIFTNLDNRDFIINLSLPPTNMVRLNLDPTQFDTNVTNIHIDGNAFVGRQYWTNLAGNLFPVGFPFNTNRFLIKANTGFTGTGTNYFGDDGVFHPLNVTIGTNDLWAAVGNVYFPAQAEDSLIATNISSAQALTALGAFVLATSLSSNLVTGENDLSAYQVGTMYLAGPTATPTDTTISLNAGNATGQIIIIENAFDNLGFSLTNNTPQWDASGTIKLIGGDWKPTQSGETMILIQSQLGNWQEATRFGGSNTNTLSQLWEIVAGNLQPQSLSLPVKVDNGIFFGPGITNSLHRDGAYLVYTNTALGGIGLGLDVNGKPIIRLGEQGSGTTTSFSQSGGSGGVASGSLLSLTGGTSEIQISGTSFNFANPATGALTYFNGYNNGSLNYSRLAVYDSGTNGGPIFDSQSGGIAGVPRPISFYIGGTNALRIANDIGAWPNNAALVFDGTGHWSAKGGGGGITVNTPSWLSYAVNSTTLGDSPIQRLSAGQMTVSNNVAGDTMPFLFKNLDQTAGTSQGIRLGWDMDDNAGTTRRAFALEVGREFDWTPGASTSQAIFETMYGGTAYSQVRMLGDGLVDFRTPLTITGFDPVSALLGTSVSATTAASNGTTVNSPGVIFRAHAWNPNVSASRPIYMGFYEEAIQTNGPPTAKLRVHTYTPTGTDADVFFINSDGRLGLQGQTNLIGDNGTALTYNGTAIGGGTGTSYWQTNTGSASISPLNTGTGFYITDTGQIGAGFPTNIFHGKDIGVFRQVDTSPLGTTPVFINTGIANTWPSPTYYSEWWSKLTTNEAVQVLVSSSSLGTFEHVWTAANDDPAGFFYYQTLSNSVPTYTLDGLSGDVSTIGSVTAASASISQGRFELDTEGYLNWYAFDGTTPGPFADIAIVWNPPGANFSANSMSIFSASESTNSLNFTAIRAIDAVAEHDGTGNLTALYAVDGDAENYGTNVVTRAQGLRGIAANNREGTVLKLVGVTSSDANANASGKVGYHASFEDVGYSSVGVTTNHYGLLLRAPTGAGIVSKNSILSESGAGVASISDGLSSLATDAAVSGTSAGWTNTFGKAAVIRFDGSALIYNVFNNALTSIYTNTVVAGHGETIIQSSGKILFTSGIVSQWVAAPF